ncbi:MAG: hypothetical protein U5K30_00185 [Acidimicrobiales bacterium]|nr:hypothetical protein [Acidimicrobiales bacterium]
MDLAAARRILGVSSADEWSTVRDAYRSLVRATHPDVAGEAGTQRTIEVNDRVRTLALARREGRLHTTEPATPAPRPAPRPPPPPRHPPPRRPDDRTVASDVGVRGPDTIVLSSTPAESFRRLVEATHLLGDISYIDRSSAMFEAILSLTDDSYASFLVTLQWRAHDATCEAFCTLEALSRAEHLDVSGVLQQLLPLIPPGHDEPRR